MTIRLASIPELKKIFIQSQGQRLGPCTVEEVKSLLASNWIASRNLGQYEGDNLWRPLSSFPELNYQTPEVLIASTPTRKKSRTVLPLHPVLAGLGLLLVVLAVIYVAIPNYREFQHRSSKHIAAKSAVSPITTAAPPVVVASTVETGQTNRGPSSTTNVAPTNVNQLASSALSPPSKKTIATNTSKGNASTRSITSTIDLQNAPFGDYDGKLIDQVRRRWIALLDQQDLVYGRSGRVTIEFQLNYRGQISEMKIALTEVGDVLAYICQRAIQESGAFPPWPSSMQKIIQQNSRMVRFTFNY